MNRSELKRATLLRDKDGYYLRLTYEQEDDNKIEKLVIPKARLYIADTPFIDYEKPEFLYAGHNVPPLVMGEAKIQISPTITLPIERTSQLIKGKRVENVNYYKEVIHTKTKEMTLEEIEEKLGHKVKLVSNKDDEKGCISCKFKHLSGAATPCYDCKYGNGKRDHYIPKE